MNIATYLSSLIASLVSVESYPDFLKRSLGWSLLFYAISYLLLGLIGASRVAFWQLPQLERFGQAAIQELEHRYPANLEFSWNGTQLLHSTTEPLTIPYPSTINPNEYDLPPLLGYHLNQEQPPADFNQLPTRSLLVITPATVFINDLQGGWNQLALTEVPGFNQPFTLTQNNVPDLSAFLRDALQSAIRLAKVAALILLPIGLGVVRLWTVLVETFLAFLLTRLNRLPLRFSQLFQLNLHIIVVAELVNQLAGWLYPTLTWPLLTITFWIVLLLVLLTQQSRLLNLTK